jgi:hypothetical protein
MTYDRKALRDAYEAIFLRYLRGEITREQRNAMVVALRDTPMAAGLTFAQRDAIANEAVEQVMEIMDQVYFEGGGGKWQ